MSILSFQDVCKNYCQHIILDHITFEVKRDEFFGLVGVNGVGKTTLIKSLLDFCEINKGQINIYNLPHTHHQARAQLVFLPEQFTPPYYLTGKNFLTFMAKLHGHAYDVQNVEAMCRMLDFNLNALKQPVKDYSKGMSQKLGLVACFLANKPLLVLDEPMNGLDPKARAYLKHHLLNLKRQGTTLFFSTHLLTDVEELCDRMAILHEGRLRFVGSPQECCEQFSTTHLEQAYLRCISASPS